MVVEGRQVMGWAGGEGEKHRGLPQLLLVIIRRCIFAHRSVCAQLSRTLAAPRSGYADAKHYCILIEKTPRDGAAAVKFSETITGHTTCHHIRPHCWAEKMRSAALFDSRYTRSPVHA